jgi:DNA modification methylase
MDAYLKFNQDKAVAAPSAGLSCEPHEVHPLLKGHQRDTVCWAVQGGRRAMFSAFGLGKTMMQLEAVRLVLAKAPEGKARSIERPFNRGLIILPLGVRQEFVTDAGKLGLTVKFIRTIEEAQEDGIYLTNYETVREGKLDPRAFTVVSLDEASVLRGFGGTKTFREFMRLFEGSGLYRFVATATPSPNEYIELLAYAAFLEVMDVGQAKAQPLDAMILTPEGWVRMGDIEPGDTVIAGDGSKTEVLGVYPQGERPVFKVTFSDGGTTECDGEHLWLTHTEYERNNERRYVQRNGREGLRTTSFARVRTATSIAETLLTDRGGVNHTIPVVPSVELDEQLIPLDPWLLGFLLGDGCLRDTNVTVSTADEWAVNEVRRMLPTGLGLRRTTPNGCDYSITGTEKQGGRGPGSNALLLALRQMDMLGRRSWEKHVPREYLFNTADIRLRILRGLMDADGTCDKSNGPTFTTTSEALANDVVFLVRSLGGLAIKANAHSTGRAAQRIRITLPDGVNPFALPRKADAYKGKPKGVRRYITSIEPAGTKPVQCIAVAHPDHLYVTDDFAVTHNTRFFKRDSTNADNLTLHAHKQDEFWSWVASWAMFLQMPSDLGYSDEGYALPPLNVQWHELPSEHSEAGADRSGQNLMFKNAALGVVQASSEKRSSIGARVYKLMEILAGIEGQCVVWCDLNTEQVSIEHALDAKGMSYASLTGSQDIEERDPLLRAWKDGKRKVFLSKPTMYGSGVNMQQCHDMVFVGIGFKAKDIIQAVHRIHRFMQEHTCNVHFIYTEAEREVRASLERKWAQHRELVANMTGLIREHGLAHAGNLVKQRSMGVARQVASGQGWTLANNDAVLEARLMDSDSVGLIITSIPFANQYEYSPNFMDFGHTDDNAHFWAQMDHLVPELLRVLAPGRVAAIHVKDRITPGGVNGFGFQTVQPFSDECIQAFIKHGFAFIARKTIVTDVVRENNQTYRLGWTEQCKDGSRMGAGMPEYVLLFRKPPTDRSNGYADTPVVKLKPLCDDHGTPAPFNAKDNWKQPIPGTGYSRALWQFDAHGFTRSSGNRLLSSDELSRLPHEKIYKIWREQNLTEIYDFAEHLRIAEHMDYIGLLPATFMLLPPHSWHPDVWTDVARMLTLNSRQKAKGKEMHLCPLQLDIVDRLIIQFSMEGDQVWDPFSGIATVGHCALRLRRRFYGSELSPGYFNDGLFYLRQAEAELQVPTLFDFETSTSMPLPDVEAEHALVK